MEVDQEEEKKQEQSHDVVSTTSSKKRKRDEFEKESALVPPMEAILEKVEPQEKEVMKQGNVKRLKVAETKKQPSAAVRSKSAAPA